MKELLDNETRAAMVDYRLERARQTLGEADLLRTGDFLMPQSIVFIMPVIMLHLLFC